jgi:predicted DsbA family dithiol-disulfide isomerase
MSEDMRRSITIDVVSDVVCPWCFVGKRKLEQALALTPELTVELNWRPFQLDPTIPQGGIARRDYMAKKFGPEKIAAIHERLEGIGAEVGVAFAFDKIERSPNTLDAHRVIRWAQPHGAQTALVERLFELYFTEGGDIGDRDLLARLAGGHGLDAAQVRSALDTNQDCVAVQQEIASAVRLGVSGVPFFILAGRFGVSGAQPPEVLADAIRRAAAEPIQA